LDDSLKKFNTKEAEENITFYNFIAYAKAISKAVKENIKKVKEIQKRYHILPVPNPAGPENGINSSKIYYQDTDFNTVNDNKIVELSKIEILNTLTLSLNNYVNNENSQTNTITGKKPIAVFPISMHQLPGSGDVTKTLLETLVAERDNMFSQANKALQEIEYALGEFSGFGICDAFVIQTALMLMDKLALAGLLDQDALNRMQSFPELKIVGTPLGIEASLQELESKVSALYQLFDQIYQDETDPVAND